MSNLNLPSQLKQEIAAAQAAAEEEEALRKQEIQRRAQILLQQIE